MEGKRSSPSFQRRLFLLLLICAAQVVFFRSVFFAVREVRVSGAERISRSDVIAAGGLQEPVSLFALDLKKLERALQEKLFLAEEIQIRRAFPFTLEVSLKERSPAFLVQEDEPLPQVPQGIPATSKEGPASLTQQETASKSQQAQPPSGEKQGTSTASEAGSLHARQESSVSPDRQGKLPPTEKGNAPARAQLPRFVCDHSGVILYPDSESLPLQLVKLPYPPPAPGGKIQEPLASQIMDTIAAVNEHPLVPCLFIQVEFTGELALVTRDRLKVRIGSGEEIARKLDLLPPLMKVVGEKKLAVEYIDLRFKDTPVVKLR